jgi:hypothetical protein
LIFIAGHTAQVKRLLLLCACVVAGGCAGNSDSSATSRFPGAYDGTWVNLANPADAGTATWTISSDGTVHGQDFDPGRDTTFQIGGHIDADGNLTSLSTPATGEPASLAGRLTFDPQGRLSGVLEWGVQPPLQYRYTFTPRR